MRGTYPHITSIVMTDYNGTVIQSTDKHDIGKKPGSVKIGIKKLRVSKMEAYGSIVDEFLTRKAYYPVNLGKVMIDTNYMEITFGFRQLFYKVLMMTIAQIIVFGGIYAVSFSVVGTFIDRILNRLEMIRKQMLMSEEVSDFGMVVSRVGHEINTPLGTAITSLSFLKQNFDTCRNKLDEADAKRIESIIEGMDEAISILGRSLSELEKIVFRFQSIIEVKQYSPNMSNVSDVIELAFMMRSSDIERMNIRVGLDMDRSIMYFTDSKALRLSIENMIENSLVHGFSNDGEHKRIYVSLKREGGDMVLSFSDNGAGISDNDKEKIFIPFYTSKKSGKNSGLGLSYVFNYFTKICGGSLTVEDASPTGTMFVARIPYDEERYGGMH